MFTGLVEEIGVIKSVKNGTKSATLSIKANKIFDDLKLGDSVCVNGVCLTVTTILDSTFTADVMNETLKKSSMTNIKNGSLVNLERAMSLNGRFGGHIVSGHIDGIGKIIKIRKDDIAIWYTIKTNNEIMKYIVQKGSITIDGISLTVASVTSGNFSVSVIPHTQKETTLVNKKIGDVVNLENDIVGKYIEKMISKDEGITENMLLKYGF